LKIRRTCPNGVRGFVVLTKTTNNNRTSAKEERT
jgi:hypothetical protein